MNAGDTNAASTLFTEKAAFIGGPPCGTPTPCIGPTAIAKRIQNAADSHHVESSVGTPTVAGNVVQLTWQVREDLDRAAQVDRILWIVQATVQNDQLASWIGVHNFDDQQTVKFNQYLASRPSAATKPS